MIHKKIFSLIMIMSLLVIPLSSAEIGSSIGNNDEGFFLQLITDLPTALLNYLLTFGDVTYAFSDGTMSFIGLNIDSGFELIREIGYLMSVRNEVLKSQSLFIIGYEYPDFCKRIHSSTFAYDSTFIPGGSVVGVYYDISTNENTYILNDEKCPT